MARRKNHFGFVFALPMIIALIVGAVTVTAVGIMVYKQVTKSEPTSTPETTTTTNLSNAKYAAISAFNDLKIYISTSLEGPWVLFDDNTSRMKYITQKRDGTFIGIATNTATNINTSPKLGGPWTPIPKYKDSIFRNITEYIVNRASSPILVATKTDGFSVSYDEGINWELKFFYDNDTNITQIPDIDDSLVYVDTGKLRTINTIFDSRTIKEYSVPNLQISSKTTLSADKKSLVVINSADKELYTIQLPLTTTNTLRKVNIPTDSPITKFGCILTLK
jgi:hypothetical protein